MDFNAIDSVLQTAFEKLPRFPSQMLGERPHPVLLAVVPTLRSRIFEKEMKAILAYRDECRQARK